MFLCRNCPRTACKSHRPMARLPPQPDLLVSLNRSIRTSATSINPVPSSPPTKAEKNSPIGLPSLQSWGSQLALRHPLYSRAADRQIHRPRVADEGVDKIFFANLEAKNGKRKIARQAKRRGSGRNLIGKSHQTDIPDLVQRKTRQTKQYVHTRRDVTGVSQKFGGR